MSTATAPAASNTELGEFLAVVCNRVQTTNVKIAALLQRLEL